MIIFLIITAMIILVTLILFVFPQFSPIPYFPSNKKDLTLILKALQIEDNQLIIDMGAGDGVIIFEAAQYAYTNRLNTQFIAIDINPILVGIMFIRRHLHPNKHNIKIIRADMFKLNLSSLLPVHIQHLTLYAYISPRFLDHIVSLATNIKKVPDISIVSYFYPIPSLQSVEKKTSGIHDIHTYKI